MRTSSAASTRSALAAVPGWRGGGAPDPAAGDPPLGRGRGSAEARYHLCPRCGRATPEAALEAYCPNDGTRLLASCPACDAPITSPFGRYCTRCGHDLRADGDLGEG